MSTGRQLAWTEGWTSAVAVEMTRNHDDRLARRSPADLASADEPALIDAFVAGRREAFDVIVLRHQRQVYRLCYRFTGNHDDAADLTQDVFLRAFRGLGRFKRDASLATWFYRITVNTCLNRAATRHIREPIDALDLVDSTTPDPLQAAIRREKAASIREAIEHLPPRQKATLVLRIYEELSHQEIARILGSTVGAAKTNLFHAIANLRRMLRP